MGLAIITGGNSGLGFEMAKLLRSLDINICLLGRDDLKLKTSSEFVKSIQGKGDVDAYRIDISSEDEVRAFGKYLRDKGQEVEYLFNAAGVGRFGPPDEMKRSDIDEVLSSNLIGMMLLTGELLSLMSHKRSRIINILSTAAKVGKAGEALYCASKWGARGYTKALQAHYKNTNIKVMAVYPGGMDTPFWSEQVTSDYMNPGQVAKQIVDTAISDLYISELVIERH
ncbi:SDR family oxidoreductase [Acidaminobacter sp. JC074]|uniref:SDR family NAD(P)-dependent oxidoreductase n=1 Tax=Acidaminobacter sp. JC074 TaxID=2530199 RepID=UPI001F0ED375|nr:SDR family oxidoreductase [Acidaminobacter sp. JC074]MCH4890061.1 SDR family oxidoreductase [Acidaminobacter sp. JC074]